MFGPVRRKEIAEKICWPTANKAEAGEFPAASHETLPDRSMGYAVVEALATHTRARLQSTILHATLQDGTQDRNTAPRLSTV